MLVFFKDTATTEIYTLSLHGALPISPSVGSGPRVASIGSITVGISAAESGDRSAGVGSAAPVGTTSSPYRSLTSRTGLDRKSTRLNSSHANISYAVFCLKQKNKPRQR